MHEHIRCNRCVCDETIPGFVVDQNGICNYCNLHDELDKQYPIDQFIIKELLHRIKKDGKNKKYDCIIGISGGCDSSYLLYKAIKWGLRPLAVHYDNGQNSEISISNMNKMIHSLKVPREDFIMDISEINDIWKAFLKSGAPDIEAPTDIALTTVLYMKASKYNIKYILGGHSFRTEGVAPIGVSYMDGRYISDVHKLFGSIPMNKFPNLWLSNWMLWLLKGIKRVRPLYHIDYNKENAKKFLNINFGWEWYGHHHGDNKFTAFFRNYYRNKVCKIDSRLTEFSALIRSGQMSRHEALEELKSSLEFENIENIRISLNMPSNEFYSSMNSSSKTHNDFKNYKSTFKKLRPLFWLAYKRNLIPKTFYIKYCK